MKLWNFHHPLRLIISPQIHLCPASSPWFPTAPILGITGLELKFLLPQYKLESIEQFKVCTWHQVREEIRLFTERCGRWDTKRPTQKVKLEEGRSKTPSRYVHYTKVIVWKEIFVMYMCLRSSIHCLKSTGRSQIRRKKKIFLNRRCGSRINYLFGENYYGKNII